MVENLKAPPIWEQRLPSAFVSNNMDNEAVPWRNPLKNREHYMWYI